jgi:hypothetical protein
MARGKSLLDLMDARELERKRGNQPVERPREPEDLWARMIGIKQKLWRSIRFFLIAFAVVLVAMLVHAYEPFRVGAAKMIGTTGASDAVRSLSVAVPMAVATGVGLAWVS